MTVVTRRTVIGGAAVAGASTAIIPLPVSGQVASDIDDFVSVSEVLTGIKKSRLAPPVDVVKIHLTYAQQAMNDPDFKDAFQPMLTAFRNNKDKKPEEIADILLNKSGTDVRYLARNIMIAWYFGSWCRKADLVQYDAPPSQLPRNQIDGAVISPAAYTQGWVWRVAGAHPMGYSDLRFGYWNRVPDFDVPGTYFLSA